MSNRHLARTIAMQSLYQWDFRGRPLAEIPEIIAHNKNEFAPDFDDKGFIAELVARTIENLSQIDALVTKYAPEWPLEQITIVDRNVLRLGVYELRFASNVPSRVAINEAIELAKTFGGESSGRFVNGVLGAIYKDILAHGEEKEIDKELPKEKNGAGQEKIEELATDFMHPASPGDAGAPS